MNNSVRAVKLRQDNPQLTLGQIGNRLGITRERVRQILTQAQVETRSAKRVEAAARPLPICKLCNNIIPSNSRRRNYKTVYCDDCRGTEEHSKAWHSIRVPRVFVYCTNCKKIIVLRKTLYERKLIQNKNIFCCHSCTFQHHWRNARA